jgi:hypothetical protein
VKAAQPAAGTVVRPRVLMSAAFSGNSDIKANKAMR